MKTIVVGIGHRARHGKDTLATKLHTLLPSESRLYSLADDLKAYCRVAHGMREKNAPLLQDVGQFYRKHYGEDFWINILQSKIEEQQPLIAIVPDVRYFNELHWVERHDGITVKVARLNEDGTLFIDPSRPADHPSECELEQAQFDYHITAKHGEFSVLDQAAQRLAVVLRSRL